MTQRGEYVFDEKEYDDGTPWIMMTPWDEDLSILKGGFIGFDLKPGTSVEEANELAERLRRIVTGVSYTDLEDGP